MSENEPDPRANTAEHPPAVGLDAVHQASGPRESERLYDQWAPHYDIEFRPSYGYIYNDEVARCFAETVDADVGPVLDIGCGTGAIGESLQRVGNWTLDGVDLSPAMLAQAAAKVDESGVPLYRSVIEADLTAPDSPIAPGSYAAGVSSGLFTHGHVGPEAIASIAAMVASGGILCLGVNEEFFDAAGFAAVLAELEGGRVITDCSLGEIRIYDESATHEHVNTMAKLILARAG